MQTELQLILTPEQSFKEELLYQEVAKRLTVDVKKISAIRILRKSIDSRSSQPKINLSVRVFYNEKKPEKFNIHLDYPFVGNEKPVIVVGAGPAGLFAALKLITSGFKPIVIERGKEARKRKIDIAQLNRNKSLDTESNYCFGEGGAGTRPA